MEHSKTIWIEGYNQKKLTYDRWFLSENEYENAITELSKIKLIDLKN
jgi:hypothetical protein